MYALYSILIRLYGFVILLVSPWHTKAKQLYKGRKHQAKDLQSQIQRWNKGHRIWIHAASYGEYEMAKPLVRELLDKGHNQILVTFHSPSGFLQTNLEHENMIKAYLPLDTKSRQQHFINLVRPSKVVFIKYEFWFNLLRVLSAQNIDYYYTSLHLNRDSYLFKPTMKPFLKLIKKSQRIYCHNERSKAILNENQFQNVFILGDTRMSQVILNKEHWEEKVYWQPNRKPVIGLGNITRKELPLIIETANSLTAFSFIIAPHDPKEDSKQLIEGIKESVDLYSSTKDFSKRILILDTMGDLRYIYGYCDAAYIGGGFEKGPHNLLEPLVFGIPIFCGPNISKFPMAGNLESMNLLKIAHHPSRFKETLVSSLDSVGPEFKSKAIKFFEEYEDKLPSLVEELLD